MRFYNVPNIIPTSTVLNTTVNSLPMQLMDAISFSIQIFFTGTPAGAFKLQASDDTNTTSLVSTNASNLPTNWTDIANSSFVVTAAGNVCWDYSFPGFGWVRVVYTDTSGGTSTAVITSATLNGKGG